MNKIDKNEKKWIFTKNRQNFVDFHENSENFQKFLKISENNWTVFKNIKKSIIYFSLLYPTREGPVQDLFRKRAILGTPLPTFLDQRIFKNFQKFSKFSKIFKIFKKFENFPNFAKFWKFGWVWTKSRGSDPPFGSTFEGVNIRNHTFSGIKWPRYLFKNRSKMVRGGQKMSFFDPFFTSCGKKGVKNDEKKGDFLENHVFDRFFHCFYGFSWKVPESSGKLLRFFMKI